PLGIHENRSRQVSDRGAWGLPVLRQAARNENRTETRGAGEWVMTSHDSNSLEQFLQDASERLQYLREYAALPVEPQSTSGDLVRLYEAAHELDESASRWGFPLFSEIAGRLAHIFQYARKAQLSPDTYEPLTEFLADAISVLEFDLLQISAEGNETVDDIAALKHRYALAFGGATTPPAALGEDLPAGPGAHARDSLPLSDS